jgi:excisionase family DNA binding protein
MTKATELRLDRPFYSPAEVAALAGVHPSTILNYIRAGKLYAVRLSERTVRIPARAVLKLLAPERVKPARVETRSGQEAERSIDDWLDQLRAEHRRPQRAR